MATNKRAQLAIIRLAMGAGVLAFSAMAWFVSQSRPLDTTPAPRGLTYAAWAVWGIALTALAVWRFIRQEKIEKGDAPSLIVGWALGEVPALFGAAYLIVTGVPTLLLVGLVIFAAAALLFPAPRG
jgi:malonyl CoA-acyl carrier protein transacylase